jgi:threonine/homoserine/homoserine lactone efflux protein
MVSIVRQNWNAIFYWIGVVMTLACFAFVIAGNAELIYRFEHRHLPLSWTFAGVAVLAFLAAEIGDPAGSRTNDAEEGSCLDVAPEWEASEA